MGLKEFAERLAADSAFAEHYRGLTSQAAVVEQAHKDGYAVTADDLAELLNAAGDGQISDEELDGVAGGTGATKCPKCGRSMPNVGECKMCELVPPCPTCGCPVTVGGRCPSCDRTPIFP